MKLAPNPGLMLLGIWLIMTGVTPLLNLNLDLDPLMNILAVAAGILILMNK
jgi:hypothetical protein